jgi:hypothetical protein
MVFNTASVIVLRSADEGATWQPVHRFSVKDRDTRDPHFLVFKDRLFVYTGTWWSGPGKIEPKEYDMNKMLGFAVSSVDGTKWSEPTMLEGTFGHYIWRAATHGGKAYLCGRRKAGFDIGSWARAATTSPSCSKAMTASSGRSAPTSTRPQATKPPFSLRRRQPARHRSQRWWQLDAFLHSLKATLHRLESPIRSTVSSAAHLW